MLHQRWLHHVEGGLSNSPQEITMVLIQIIKKLLYLYSTLYNIECVKAAVQFQQENTLSRGQLPVLGVVTKYLVTVI